MKQKIVLISILLLAGVLRLWQLSSYPSGFNADEAALGYNAYSLSETGRDEHGHLWPVNLESFGDFKPALYAYILIPLVKIFGLTEFIVRFPSAIFGVLTVFFIYLFTNELLLKSNKEFNQTKPSLTPGHYSALLLAISPWAIQFSRGAWETNVATCFILIALWSFVKWLKTTRTLYLGLCVTHLALSMYTYQSARLLAPLLGLILFLVFWRKFTSHLKASLLCFVLLFLLLIPLSYSIITSDASSRLSGVGLLSDIGPTRRVEELRGQHSDWQSISSRVLHNRITIYLIQYVKNYTDHFNGDFLFVNGDQIQRNRVPETGLLYTTDIILIIIGVIALLKAKSSYVKILGLWLLIAPTASALTFQTPHAVRAHNLSIPLVIIMGYGLWYILNNSKRRFVILVGILFISVYSWQFARFIHEYTIHYPKTYPTAWEYGFKDLVSYVKNVQQDYTKIWVTDKYDQPYILFLYYLKYAPEKFQNGHILTFRDVYNFSTVRDFSNYHFSSTPWERVKDSHQTLIVAAPEDVPLTGVDIIKTFTYPNGQPVFVVYKN